ncbi:hypothetical protein SNR37_001875 [Agarivorans aestuarii]|uniref:Uncharacterized protein n=1 Tax=Agarivorans aestuarii TaxID=1563703 RepID=A0ABU7FZE4_9ALTE|nr:hypothetical protein [Agarivorans aestuarii]MEE1672546.1 hypothetical protein [Agarivorans aestuarii]
MFLGFNVVLVILGSLSLFLFGGVYIYFRKNMVRNLFVQRKFSFTAKVTRLQILGIKKLVPSLTEYGYKNVYNSFNPPKVSWYAKKNTGRGEVIIFRLENYYNSLRYPKALIVVVVRGGVDRDIVSRLPQAYKVYQLENGISLAYEDLFFHKAKFIKLIEGSECLYGETTSLPDVSQIMKVKKAAKIVGCFSVLLILVYELLVMFLAGEAKWCSKVGGCTSVSIEKSLVLYIFMLSSLLYFIYALFKYLSRIVANQK